MSGSVSDRGTAGVSQESPDPLDAVKPKINNEPNGTYDRESIIRELAEIRDSSLLDYVLNVERMRKGSEEPLDDFGGGVEEIREKILGESVPRSDFEKFREALRAVPDSILHLLLGSDRPGDCGRPSDQKPEWLDVEKLRRGQKFAEDYIFSIFFAEALSMFALFSFDDGLRPLVFTGKATTPYTSFKRMLSSGLRHRNWYTKDLWNKESPAWKDILNVRAMHAAVRRRMDRSTDEEIVTGTKIADAWCPLREVLRKDFSETCNAPTIGQCPYMTSRNNPSRSKGINQMDMAVAQWSLVGLLICIPHNCGARYATEQQLDDYCYFWRNVGYQLGIEDEFNFCRGTLEDVRQRSRDILETWIKPNFREITPEWEHTVRCLVSGTSVLIPVSGNFYETALLYLTEILGLRMPRLYASLSYKDWIIYNVAKFSLNYVIGIPGIRKMVNYLLNKSLDRIATFDPEELEALRIKLSDGFGNYAKTGS